MTAPETQLRTARERLEAMRDASSPGQWERVWEAQHPSAPMVVSDECGEVVPVGSTEADAALIALLQHTLADQISLLTAAEWFARLEPGHILVKRALCFAQTIDEFA